MSLSPVDLLILLIYLGGVVAFGAWIGRGATTAKDYMLGGRDLPWWVILASIIATETSTVTFLSIPGFAYQRDLTWLQLAMGYILGRLVVSAIFLPRYFSGRIFTSYEVLQERFGLALRQAASALFILTRSLADGLRLFLSAIVLEEMTGLPLAVAVILLGAATILYTLRGGLKAVLWTDLIQLAVYVGGACFAVAVLGRRVEGGWSRILELGHEAGKLRIFDFSTDLSEPYTLWAGLIGGAVLSLATHGVDQLMVQRYLAARDLAGAKRAVSLSGILVFAQFLLFLGLGVGLFVFYQLTPPEVAFERADRIFARFILDEIPTGLLGVLLGAVFAAAMSTLSSSLNSCATAAVRDLWLPRAKQEPTARAQLRTTRTLTLIFGLVQIGVGIGGSQLDSSVVSAVLGISGFTTGIVLGIFVLALLGRRVSGRSALVGFGIGLGCMLLIFFATDLAWPWYSLVGGSITMAAGLVAEWIGRLREGDSR